MSLDADKNIDKSSNKSSIGSMMYSPDLVVDNLSLDTMLGHTLASLCIGPIRLTTRIFSNLALLSPIYLAKCMRNIIFINIFLFVLSLIQSFFIKTFYFPIISFITVCIFCGLYYHIKRKELIELNEKEEVDFDIESIETECNKIYDILDKILKEELK